MTDLNIEVQVRPTRIGWEAHAMVLDRTWEGEIHLGGLRAIAWNPSRQRACRSAKRQLIRRYRDEKRRHAWETC